MNMDSMWPVIVGGAIALVASILTQLVSTWTQYLIKKRETRAQKESRLFQLMGTINFSADLNELGEGLSFIKEMLGSKDHRKMDEHLLDAMIGGLERVHSQIQVLEEEINRNGGDAAFSTSDTPKE